MGRGMDRNARSNLVMRALNGRNGWALDPHSVNAGKAWTERFPKLPYVRDSREETGNTTAGRGTTALDMFRSFEIQIGLNRDQTEVVRSDFLSIKTDNLGDDNKFPAKIELSTGLSQTLEAIMDGVSKGASLPTLLFVSRTLENERGPYPDPQGFAMFLDLGPILRDNAPVSAEEQPEGGYGKGNAPAVYYKWSSARKCGGGSGGNRGDESCDYGARVLHFEMTSEPLYDNKGRKWTAPDKVHYPELVVNLSKLGYTRKSGAWQSIHVSQLAEFLENQDWEKMAGQDGTLIG